MEKPSWEGIFVSLVILYLITLLALGIRGDHIHTSEMEKLCAGKDMVYSNFLNGCTNITTEITNEKHS